MYALKLQYDAIEYFNEASDLMRVLVNNYHDDETVKKILDIANVMEGGTTVYFPTITPALQIACFDEKSRAVHMVDDKIYITSLIDVTTDSLVCDKAGDVHYTAPCEVNDSNLFTSMRRYCSNVPEEPGSMDECGKNARGYNYIHTGRLLDGRRAYIIKKTSHKPNGEPKLLLVRLFRPSIGRYVYDVPTGAIYDGESENQAADRILGGVPVIFGTQDIDAFMDPQISDSRMRVMYGIVKSDYDVSDSVQKTACTGGIESLWLTPSEILDLKIKVSGGKADMTAMALVACGWV